MAVDEAWLSLVDEDVFRPEQPIVDAHHHLWARPYYPYELDRLLDDFSCGHNVRASVFVECSSHYRPDLPQALAPVGEVEHVDTAAQQALAVKGGRVAACAAIVGYADLSLGEAVGDVLHALREASPQRLRGVRNIAVHDPSGIRSTQFCPPAGLLGRPEFRAGFSSLARHQLTFDTWLYHPQLHELCDLVADFPDTLVVVDHLGGPLGVGPYARRTAEVFSRWRQGLRALAEHPNVRLKLGGMAMPVFGFDLRAGVRPASSDELVSRWRPYIEVAIDTFGPERCMFESNFPVDKGACSYRVLWNAYKKLAATYSAAEQLALLAGTAVASYRIENLDLALHANAQWRAASSSQ